MKNTQHLLAENNAWITQDPQQPHKETEMFMNLALSKWLPTHFLVIPMLLDIYMVGSLEIDSVACLEMQTKELFPANPVSQCLPSATVFSSDGECALACTLEAIGVYWKCALDCVKYKDRVTCIALKCVDQTAKRVIDCLDECSVSNLTVTY